MTTIIEEIARKGSDKERIAETIRRRPEQLSEVLDGLNAEPAAIKFGCAKVLRLISVIQPELLYPHFDRFVRLLDHPNKIFQWEAILVLAELVRVDKANRFEAVFPRYFAPIAGPVMITAANTIGGAAQIARARPAWADRIAREILKVSRARYQTRECRNVAIGKAIEAFGEIFDLLNETKPTVVNFVRRQVKNSRAATAKKAQVFLRKFAQSQPRESKDG
jgi:hypothetical protein